MEHGLKVIAFYVQKAYNTLHSCHNFPAGSRQAVRGARICETSLLQVHLYPIMKPNQWFQSWPPERVSLIDGPIGAKQAMLQLHRSDQQFYRLLRCVLYGYAPVIRLVMAISERHAHIHADKTDISR